MPADGFYFRIGAYKFYGLIYEYRGGRIFHWFTKTERIAYNDYTREYNPRDFEQDIASRVLFKIRANNIDEARAIVGRST